MLISELDKAIGCAEVSRYEVMPLHTFHYLCDPNLDIHKILPA